MLAGVIEVARFIVNIEIQPLRSKFDPFTVIATIFQKSFHSSKESDQCLFERVNKCRN